MHSLIETCEAKGWHVVLGSAACSSNFPVRFRFGSLQITQGQLFPGPWKLLGLAPDKQGGAAKRVLVNYPGPTAPGAIDKTGFGPQ